jgi:hypothetical protein
MYKDGFIENNVVICDLEHASPWSLPLRALQSFNQTMTLQFRCKNSFIFVVNVANSFLGAWKAIKSWIDPMIVNKV